MKKLLLIYLFLVTVTFSSAQVVIQLEKQSDTKTEPEKNSIIYSFDINLVGTPDESPIIINVSASKLGSATENSDFEILTKKITINASDFSGGKAIATVKMSINNDTSSENNEFALIELQATCKNCTVLNSKFVLTLTDPEKAEPEKPSDLQVYVGTNFDYTDKLKVKSIYFHTRYFSESVFKIFNWKDSKIQTDLGINTGIYQTRSFSSDSMGRIRSFNYRLPLVAVEDSVLGVSEIDTIYSNTTISNQGLYASFPITLSHSGKNNRATLFIAPYVEVLKRNFTTSISYIPSSTDTFKVSEDSLLLTKDLIAPPKINATYYEGYFGLGLGIRLKSKPVELELWGYMGKIVAANGRLPIYTPTAQPINYFYLVQGMVKEPSSGLTISAEVRGYLPKYSPYVTVTISKAIDFKDLGNLITGSN